jgi:hypothetical protein
MFGNVPFKGFLKGSLFLSWCRRCVGKCIRAELLLDRYVRTSCGYRIFQRSRARIAMIYGNSCVLRVFEYDYTSIVASSRMYLFLKRLEGVFSEVAHFLRLSTFFTYIRGIAHSVSPLRFPFVAAILLIGVVGNTLWGLYRGDTFSWADWVVRVILLLGSLAGLFSFVSLKALLKSSKICSALYNTPGDTISSHV